MKFELKYFTGTGNSLKVINTFKEIFVENNHLVNVSSIKKGGQIVEADIIGFCFPVYAFGIPRICRNYLKELPKFKNEQKAFIIITAGDNDESGFSIFEGIKILKKKNCKIVYSAVVQMPINWTTSPEPPLPPTKEEAVLIIDKGVNQTRTLANDILKGIEKFHMFNFPKRYNKPKFYCDYLLFIYFGVSNLWRNFKVHSKCNGCSICSKICPTKSISIKENKPIWSATCEQCMRCVNFCPNGSIYQSFGGDTKGKNRYYEPSFNPLNERNPCRQ